VGALTVFAVVLALTGLLLVGQAIARQTFLDANDNDALRALGTTRGQLFLTAMLRATLIALAGAVLAVVIAVAASPLTPIGVARSIEPDPGIDFAWGILGAGFVVTVVVVLALAVWPAWRTAGAHATDVVATRPSRLVSAVSDAGLSVPAAAGVRMALEPGRGRTAVPVRTTIIGAGLAIATVLAAGVFAVSLDHLVSTPRLFGWNWDREFVISVDKVTPESEAAQASMAKMLDSSPAVARWGTVSLSDVTIDGSPISAVGIDRRRNAAPTLVAGSLPKRDGEIALGHLTMRELGVGIGDGVVARDLGGGRVPLKVVGTVVLPGLGTYPGADKTSLGEGAVLTREQLYQLGSNFGADDYVVAFDPGATTQSRAAVVANAEKIVTDVDPEGFNADGVQRPSDILAYDRVRSTPLFLALVLAVLASATVAHALVSAVRRQRRDHAILANHRLTRRQISSTVAWQSTTVGVLALVIGVPLGIIGGRWAWGLLADDLGTLSEPKVPILAIAIGIPVVLLLCNAVAYVPGRIAARMKPAAVLRSE
jgi:predicted lysophospholipase L1 biosynthesis ABC-type transport system permease subunit